MELNPRTQVQGVRVLWWGAALLAGIGLLLVWGVARHTTVPTLRARDVDDKANWAFVQLCGVVTRYPAYDEESGYLGFWIDDDSGEVLVTSYRSTSRALLERGNVPAIGDRVTVRGTLRVRQGPDPSSGTVSLVLNAPEHLAVERPVHVELPIAEAAEETEYQKVQVIGQVREVRTPYEGLTVVHVRDGTGGIDLVYDRDLIRLHGAPIQVRPGDSVRAHGALTHYRGQPQVSLESAEGLRRVSYEIAVGTDRPIGEIGLTDEGRWVRVRGTVTDVRSLSTGLKCTLADGTGEIALVLWKNVLDQLDERFDLRPGGWLDVQGVVAQYRGQLEVVPELGSDVRALRPPAVSHAPEPTAVPSTATPLPLDAPSHVSGATPTDTPAPLPPSAAPIGTVAATSDAPHVPTGLLSAVHLGQRRTVQGQIVEAAQFSSGVRAHVDDRSGPVVVWMPRAVYGKLLEKTGWRVGSRVRVTGRVDRYREEIEIVLHSASDVFIVDAAPSLWEATVPIADLAARVGEWATIEGEVVAVEPFSQGHKLLVRDGGAQITVLLWQNVYEVLPDRDRLVVGAVVRAMGQVQEYRGELELVPGLGIDVALVPRAVRSSNGE